VPLTAIGIWQLARLPAGERYPDATGAHDFTGIVLFAIATSAGIYWLTSAGHHFEWTSALSFGIIATAVVAGFILIRHEKRHPAPLMPLELLEQPEIAWSLLTVSAFAACMFALVFFVPIYLQLGHGVSAMHSGLLLLPFTIGTVTGALLAGRIVARSGVGKPLPVAGLSFASLSLFLLGALPPSTTLVGVLGFFAGTGLGPVMPTNQVVLQTLAGRARLGRVTALMALFRSVGAALGAAVFGALAFGLMPNMNPGAIARTVDEAQLKLISHAFHMAFMLTALAAAGGAYAASRVPRIVLWSKAEASVVANRETAG
jgi:predicted MFS family arabinose efflux permease